MITTINDSELGTVTGLPESLVFAYESEGYDNRLLSMGEVKKFIHSHGVLSCDVPESTDGWTLFDMLSFLGY